MFQSYTKGGVTTDTMHESCLCDSVEAITVQFFSTVPVAACVFCGMLKVKGGYIKPRK